MSAPATRSTAPEANADARAANAAADRRIAVIDDSLKCLLCGALTCVPLLGAMFILSAVRSFRGARANPSPWNPARRALAAGLALASVGWLINLVAWWVALFKVAMAVSLDQPFAEAELIRSLPIVVAVGFPVALAGWIMAMRALLCPRKAA